MLLGVANFFLLSDSKKMDNALILETQKRDLQNMWQITVKGSFINDVTQVGGEGIRARTFTFLSTVARKISPKNCQ